MKLKENPYEMLACKVFARYTDRQLNRLLQDKDYLAELVLEELWDLDYTGVFLDVVFENLGRNSQAKVNEGLQMLAKTITELIDIDRLIKELMKLA